MKNELQSEEKLWPIIGSIDGVGPVGHAVLNAGAVFAVATPFLMAVVALCLGFWLANLVEAALLDMFGVSARVAFFVATTLKVAMSLFAAQVLWRMVPFIPNLVRGARAVVSDEEA